MINEINKIIKYARYLIRKYHNNYKVTVRECFICHSAYDLIDDKKICCYKDVQWFHSQIYDMLSFISNNFLTNNNFKIMELEKQKLKDLFALIKYKSIVYFE